MSAAVASRPRISADYLTANTQRRIIAGTASVVAERGYEAATVADIVKACGVARNTFYENYGSKEQAALAIVAALGIEIEDLSESPSVDVLAIELAAIHRSGDPARASDQILAGEQLVRFLAECKVAAPPPSSDPREGTLPPGRHGLPAEFVKANQRTRLLTGTAASIVERGYPAVRISDITGAGAVSRRTFYEHFDSAADATRAMIDAAVTTNALDGSSTRSGIFAVAAEIVAARLLLDQGRPGVADQAVHTLNALTVAFEAS
jgi:AcrR family transcriptional regulator